jgi:hypothetical protein
MKRIIFVFCLFFLLAACSTAPSGNAVPTPTFIPLADLDLRPVLVLPGDLPTGYTAAQFSTTLPAIYSKLILPDKTFYQQFTSNNQPAGGIAVMLYDSPILQVPAYDLVADMLYNKENPVPGLGTKALSSQIELAIGPNISEVVFIECRSLVHIRINGILDSNQAITYARRLDERIKKLVCRNP